MIRLEHTVFASTEQMQFIIEGMRNPMNSWDKSDSDVLFHMCENWEVGKDPSIDAEYYNLLDNCGINIKLGENDASLMKRLANAGTDHRKFMRQMPVYVRITAPLYWWKEFDTYKVGTVSNSCSTMHKIQAKEFVEEDFSFEHIYENVEEDQDPGDWVSNQVYVETQHIISALNAARHRYLETNDKKYWWQMIQLLPSSYNQTRNVSMNYEVLANIYKSRKAHKLYEWRDFCKWIETLPYSYLITGKEE